MTTAETHYKTVPLTIGGAIYIACIGADHVGFGRHYSQQNEAYPPQPVQDRDSNDIVLRE